jgi:hypothetical protein
MLVGSSVAKVSRLFTVGSSLVVNWLLGADTQPKAAAARRGLRAGQRQRYPS